jgi:hypothetical protein
MTHMTRACLAMGFCSLFLSASGSALRAQQPASGQKPSPAAPAPAAQKPKPAAAAPATQKPKPGAAAPAWPKRLKDGQPDVSGIWDPLVTLGCFGGLGPGCIIDPPDKQIPYQPWALARRNEVRAVMLKPNAAQMDTRSRAWPDGVPRANFYHEFQIMQVPGAVVILYEMQHEFRYIPLDSRPQPDPAIQLWHHSGGRCDQPQRSESAVAVR